jgi:hypothetical protein
MVLYVLQLLPILAKTQFKNLPAVGELDKLLLSLREMLELFKQWWLVWIEADAGFFKCKNRQKNFLIPISSIISVSKNLL